MCRAVVIFLKYGSPACVLCMVIPSRVARWNFTLLSQLVNLAVDPGP